MLRQEREIKARRKCCPLREAIDHSYLLMRFKVAVDEAPIVSETQEAIDTFARATNRNQEE